MFKPLRTFTIGLAVMVGLVGMAPVPANALTPPKWRELTWRNRVTGFCLGVAGGNVTNGTPIIVWRCNGNTDQTWTVDFIAQNGRPPFLVRNGTNRNKCLSVANNSRNNGAQMVIWDCKPLETNKDQRCSSATACPSAAPSSPTGAPARSWESAPHPSMRALRGDGRDV